MPGPRRRAASPGPGAGEESVTSCRANQALRLQTQDALALQKRNPFRTASLFAQRAPGPWLKRANVPVFLVGQFQDEQTGGISHRASALNGKPRLDLAAERRARRLARPQHDHALGRVPQALRGR